MTDAIDPRLFDATLFRLLCIARPRGWVTTHSPAGRTSPMGGHTSAMVPQMMGVRSPLVSDPDMHHGTCMTHVPWCMSGSLTRDGGENVPGSRRMRKPQFYVYGKRPMGKVVSLTTLLSIRWCQTVCCDGCGVVLKTNTQVVDGLHYAKMKSATINKNPQENI